jgi:subtilisin-like proprotein convertase family protein
MEFERREQLVKHCTTTVRIAVIALTALLALPLAPIASPVEAKQRSRIITRTFRNPAPMNLPISTVSPVSASRYPSAIEVRGLKGPIRDVNVRLNHVFHTSSYDMDVLLVGPSGQTAIVMSDIGEKTNTSGVTLLLDDEASSPIPDASLESGVYRPTNNDEIVAFNVPAPPVTTANAALSIFDGGDPNGEWRLFVQDRYGKFDSGIVAGGWELEITTKAKKKKKR